METHVLIHFSMTDHPSPKELLAYCAQTASALTASRVEEHVNECEECVKLVIRIVTGRSAGTEAVSTHRRDAVDGKTHGHSLHLVDSRHEFRALTQREGEVLRLICNGHGTKEIAAELGISFKTAVTHRTSIMQKANVHDPISLFRWALLNELVSVPKRNISA